MVQVSWTRWPPCPNIVKTLQKSFSLEPVGWLPWSIGYWGPIVIYSNEDPGMTITYSRPRSNLVTSAFLCEKKWTVWNLFLTATVSSKLVDAVNLMGKWCYRSIWKSRSWPWANVTQISKFKFVFLRNDWAIWNQISYESSWEKGNEKIF